MNADADLLRLLGEVSALRTSVLRGAEPFLEDWRPHIRNERFRASVADLARNLALRRSVPSTQLDWPLLRWPRLAALGVATEAANLACGAVMRRRAASERSALYSW